MASDPAWIDRATAMGYSMIAAGSDTGLLQQAFSDLVGRMPGVREMTLSRRIDPRPAQSRGRALVRPPSAGAAGRRSDDRVGVPAGGCVCETDAGHHGPLRRPLRQLADGQRRIGRARRLPGQDRRTPRRRLRFGRRQGPRCQGHHHHQHADGDPSPGRRCGPHHDLRAGRPAVRKRPAHQGRALERTHQLHGPGTHHPDPRRDRGRGHRSGTARTGTAVRLAHARRRSLRRNPG